jgi:hypothetical protein
MGKSRRRRSDRAGRAPMRSPGRPPVARREHRQRFWAAIADGMSSDRAGVVAGVSPAVGVRWFREGGGMPSVSRAPLSGRYLSFAEREEIAILKAGGCGVREIARRMGRSASTISRELRRQRRDPKRRVGVSGHDRAVACRPAGSAPQAGQARRQPEVARVRAKAAGRRDRDARWHGGAGSGGALDRAPSRTPQGPPLGQVVESGADREPAPGGLPR